MNNILVGKRYKCFITYNKTYKSAINSKTGQIQLINENKLKHNLKFFQNNTLNFFPTRNNIERNQQCYYNGCDVINYICLVINSLKTSRYILYAHNTMLESSDDCKHQ